MSITSILTCIELGLFYSLMTSGLFISYRILNVADLTVDGSFTLGACVSAVLAIAGHPVLGIILAGLAGGLAGLVTATLQTKLKVQPILSGILTMTALYSINILVMGGKPNLPLNRVTTIFTIMQKFFATRSGLILAIIAAALVAIFLVIFLKTRLGLFIRATGDNEDMVRASSINVDAMKMVGLSLANALVAISGGLIAQYQSFSDIQSGVGMVVIGLASLIIGEIVFGRKSITLNILAAIAGSIAYRFIIQLALEINISFSSMKLVSAVIIIVAISIPTVKNAISHIQKKRRSKIHAKNQ